jgi:hypothetical protein
MGESVRSAMISNKVTEAWLDGQHPIWPGLRHGEQLDRALYPKVPWTNLPNFLVGLSGLNEGLCRDSSTDT